MKLKTLCALAVIIGILAGCGSDVQKVKYGETTEKVLVDATCENQNFRSLKSGAYCEDGFYTFEEESVLVYFVDKKSNQAQPLCYKIGCLHDNFNCSAYYAGVHGIYYTDSYLYVLSSDSECNYECLYRMKHDGSEKTEVSKLFAYEEEDMGWSLQFIIHRGFGYLAINWMDTDAVSEREQKLYKVSLEDGSKKEIYKMSGLCPQIIIANTCGDNIYLSTSVYKDAVSKELIKSAIHYNISSGEITEVNVAKGMLFRACYNDKVYSLSRERVQNKDDYAYYEKKLEVYESDIDGRGARCIYSLPEDLIEKEVTINQINIDEKYLYLFGYFKSGGEVARIISLDNLEVYEYDFSGMGEVWSDKEFLLMQDSKTREYILHNIVTGNEVRVVQ